ncbi:unnamed protein product [Linum tenue]|uniref:BRI1 kinase inhibitor 1 n=1 Tax=Linum tenue TaxID=586396 RepID=A0AAV0RNR3_9ROSI|nr:unnamed protein product [Linum tenue]
MDGTQLLGDSKAKVVELDTTMKEDIPAAAAAAISPASPPSATTSPSHEFSFTVSLHSSSTATLPATIDNSNKSSKPTTQNPSFAIDLSPADDIFFHGHLLPLHLLSHLPVSPRSSTNSMDSFTLPIKELMGDQIASNRTSTTTNPISQKAHSTNNIRTRPSNHHHESIESSEEKGRSKSKSFSLFGWRKRCEAREREEEKEKQQKKRLKFDVSHILKRYARIVRHTFRGRKENHPHFQRQPRTFSGHLSVRNNKHELRGRRGELFSAPASMRTSPSNSGVLCTIPPSTNDSTMEELQAAIQAAIAHCKNSIATEEKNKC